MDASAAGRRLSVLARRFGIPLAVRDGDRLYLTAAGWSVYRIGGQLIDVIDHVVDTFAPGADPDRSGRRVSMLVPSLSLSTVPAVPGTSVELADLLASALPGTVTEIRSAPGTDPGSLFESYQVDVACGWQSPSARPMRRPATVVTAVREQLWVALPMDHPQAARSTASMAELGDETWMTADDGLGRAVLDQALRAHRLAPAVVTVGTDAAVRGLVAMGRGVALMSPLAAPETRHRPAGFVLRPIEGAPWTDLVLSLDPLVDAETVGRRLVAVLRTLYADRAETVNPAYRRSRSFPAWPAGPLEPARPGVDILLRRVAGGPSDRPGFEPAHLTLLETVHRAGSLTRAAKSLLVSQPALMRRLRRLEERSGVGLLHTSPAGSRLSAQARMLLVRTQAARTALEDVVHLALGAVAG